MSFSRILFGLFSGDFWGNFLSLLNCHTGDKPGESEHVTGLGEGEDRGAEDDRIRRGRRFREEFGGADFREAEETWDVFNSPISHLNLHFRDVICRNC